MLAAMTIATLFLAGSSFAKKGENMSVDDLEKAKASLIIQVQKKIESAHHDILELQTKAANKGVTVDGISVAEEKVETLAGKINDINKATGYTWDATKKEAKNCIEEVEQLVRSAKKQL